MCLLRQFISDLLDKSHLGPWKGPPFLQHVCNLEEVPSLTLLAPLSQTFNLRNYEKKKILLFISHTVYGTLL